MEQRSHEEEAQWLLDEAGNYVLEDRSRTNLLLEAQVRATLALAAAIRGES